MFKERKKMNREIIERNKKKRYKGKERKSNTSISRKKIVC
jgi:hypothetical protein